MLEEELYPIRYAEDGATFSVPFYCIIRSLLAAYGNDLGKKTSRELERLAIRLEAEVRGGAWPEGFNLNGVRAH